jgi:hypothetical protein
MIRLTKQEQEPDILENVSVQLQERRIAFEFINTPLVRTPSLGPLRLWANVNTWLLAILHVFLPGYFRYLPSGPSRLLCTFL